MVTFRSQGTMPLIILDVIEVGNTAGDFTTPKKRMRTTFPSCSRCTSTPRKLSRFWFGLGGFRWRTMLRTTLAAVALSGYLRSSIML
eukprot:6213176-Pleurochrysis_carterae.AAC.2